jgi:hypothetical protein
MSRRLPSLKGRRSPVPPIEHAIASIYEELGLTLNFVASMIEGESFHSALEVIEEQRRSLRRRLSALSAPKPRHRQRTVAALALAAALVFGTGAFAGIAIIRSESPLAPKGPAAVRVATQALRRAIATHDPQALRELVGQAQTAMLQLAPTAVIDTQIRTQLKGLISQQRQLMKLNKSVPTDVMKRAEELARQVEESLEQASKTEPKPSPKTEKRERPRHFQRPDSEQQTTQPQPAEPQTTQEQQATADAPTAPPNPAPSPSPK